MQRRKPYLDPILLAVLNLLGVISLLGFIYCLVVLLYGNSSLGSTDVTLFLVWFAISLLSVLMLREGDIWGAYAIGVATLTIAIYELVNGTATWGGALLGGLVMLIVIETTLYTAPENNDDRMSDPT